MDFALFLEYLNLKHNAVIVHSTITKCIHHYNIINLLPIKIY